MKKIRLAALSALTLFLALTARFVIGRYTDILNIRAGHPNEVVFTFTEPLIEKAARLMQNKAEGEPVY